MKRIAGNIKYIFKISMKYSSAFFAIVGIIALFTPFNELFGETQSWLKILLLSCVVIFGVWCVIFIICCLYICFKNKFEVLDVGNGHHVYVQYGDVFSEDVVSEDSSRNIVIPVNRCFDTIIDDDLISSRTLHGISMKKLYDDHLFTQERLNDEIQGSLLEKGEKFIEVQADEKRKGNLKRYETGTIVEIPTVNRATYFFLALTTFDRDLHAHTGDDEYVLALMKMLMYNNKRSQGKPLVLPLIGAGAADTRKEERDILEYIVKLFKMNRKLINCDVHIVVRNTAKGSIAITDL